MRPRSPFALVLVLAFAGLMLAPVARAANEIAYGCDMDVCLLDPANPGAVTDLTDNGEASYDEKPIWSPDGTKVAFVSDFTSAGHGEHNVFVMQAAGTGDAINLATQITKYTSGAKQIADLAWSPDGAASPTRAATTRATTASGSSTPMEPRPSRSRSAGEEPSDTRPGRRTARGSPTPSSKTSRTDLRRVLARRHGPAMAEWRRARTELVSRRLQNRLRRLPAADLATSTSTSSPPTAAARRWSPQPVHGVDLQPLVAGWGRFAYRATAASGGKDLPGDERGGGGDHPLASPGEGDARSRPGRPTARGSSTKAP